MDTAVGYESVGPEGPPTKAPKVISQKHRPHRPAVVGGASAPMLLPQVAAPHLIGKRRA
ncbi:hypothetical protein GLE_1462 [Lysobacter enzymogenes]|uniref:Uncharacterized protein n=1 Tax=Lysobacter enzymogenes TaxID=69 RepID=A0A0S2DEC2_LYSEN|nr:hypothetical protein GLE_1462 [Lysobacter enzymogenes]